MSSNSPQTEVDLKKCFIFIGLAALQFGLQPFFSNWYAKEAIESTVVIGAELCKILVSSLILWYQGELFLIYSGWNFWNSIKTAGIPAVLYAIINVLYQTSYNNLDGVIFNFLNQTKLFWCAVFLWIFLRKPQSEEQIVALVMLTIAAFMLTLGQYKDKQSSFLFGVIPVLIGSVLSGVATTVSQKVLQNDNKNTYLYTSELAVWGIFTLIFISLLNYEEISQKGIFSGWTVFTLVPIFTNAIGGILVGLVVKYAGGVRKGFGTVAGMFLTAVLSFLINGTPFTVTMWISLPLLIASVYIHTTYPYRTPPAPTAATEVNLGGNGKETEVVDIDTKSTNNKQFEKAV